MRSKELIDFTGQNIDLYDGPLIPEKWLIMCKRLQFQKNPIVTTVEISFVSRTLDELEHSYICDAGEADGGIRLTSFNTKTTSLHDLEAGQLYSNR